jgi:hypothetical protein
VQQGADKPRFEHRGLPIGFLWMALIRLHAAWLLAFKTSKVSEYLVPYAIAFSPVAVAGLASIRLMETAPPRLARLT